jgi:hypothetical protein
MNNQKTQIISFFGAPGVGKTHLIEQVSPATGIFYFDREVILDSIFKDDRESANYRSLTGPITAATWNIAMRNAQIGASTILESPMTPTLQGKPSSFIDDALKLAEQQNGIQVKLIYCVAPENQLMINLKKRGLKRDEPKYSDWNRYVEMFVNVPGPTGLYEHLRIDTTRSTQENVKTILNYLQK